MTTSTRNQPAPPAEQQQSKPAQKPTPISKSSKKQRWLKVIEFAVVGFATWLNPQAGFLIFLLKFCFQILEVLQDEEQTSR